MESTGKEKGAGHSKETMSSTSWRNWLSGLITELTPVWMRRKPARTEVGPGDDHGRN